MNTRPWLAAIPVTLALVCLIFTVAPASAKRQAPTPDADEGGIIINGKVHDGMMIFNTIHPVVDDPVDIELKTSFIPQVVTSTERLEREQAIPNDIVMTKR